MNLTIRHLRQQVVRHLLDHGLTGSEGDLLTEGKGHHCRGSRSTLSKHRQNEGVVWSWRHQVARIGDTAAESDVETTALRGGIKCHPKVGGEADIEVAGSRRVLQCEQKAFSHNQVVVRKIVAQTI